MRFDLRLHGKGEPSSLKDGIMANEKSPPVLGDMRTLFHVGTSSGLTDAQLLDRFRARSDRNSSEAAFAGLMARHGPMVLGVCRRALRNPDDVADAFQATFLITEKGVHDRDHCRR